MIAGVMLPSAFLLAPLCGAIGIIYLLFAIPAWAFLRAYKATLWLVSSMQQWARCQADPPTVVYRKVPPLRRRGRLRPRKYA